MKNKTRNKKDRKKLINFVLWRDREKMKFYCLRHSSGDISEDVTLTKIDCE